MKSLKNKKPPLPQKKKEKKPLFLPLIKLNKTGLSSKKDLTKINLKKVYMKRKSITELVRSPKKILLKINKSEGNLHKEDQNEEIPEQISTNLYKGLYDEIKKQKEEAEEKQKIKEEQEKEEKIKKIEKLREQQEIKNKKKINLNEVVKEMLPKIDDLAEFEKEIQLKHKNLFETILPLLFSKKEKNKSNHFSMPKMLYDDIAYFRQRFGKKRPLKKITFSDGNMLYPNILDYNEYIIKIKQLLKLYKGENFVDNAFDFKESFYEDILTQIEYGYRPKIISFHKEKNENETALFEKYQKFIHNQKKEQNQQEDLSTTPIKKENASSDLATEDSKIFSFFKNKYTSNSKLKQLLMSEIDQKISNNHTSTLPTLVQFNNDLTPKIKIQNKDTINMSESESYENLDEEKENRLLEKRNKSSQDESKFDEDSASFLDNSYIFENSPIIQDKQKFVVKIKKKVELSKKREKSLYDVYFTNKMNKKKNML